MVSASAKNAGDPWCESRFGATDFCARIHLFISFCVSFLNILILNNLSEIPESIYVHHIREHIRAHKAFTVLFIKRALYRHLACNVPVTCKANGVRNQLARQ